MLTTGLVFIGIGFALIASLKIGKLNNWFMPVALIVLFIGIALTLSYYLPRKKWEKALSFDYLNPYFLFD